jgi:oligopeptide transport system substrate-binding protein
MLKKINLKNIDLHNIIKIKKTYLALMMLSLYFMLIFSFMLVFSSPSYATDKDSITIATMGEPASLDVHYARGGTWEYLIYQDVYSGLMERNAKGKPSLAVAKSYSLSSDGKVYTFKLKKTFWSDGTPLTAHDFEYSFKRNLSQEVASNYAFLLYIIKNAKDYNGGKISADKVGVKALNDDTLQITLEYPASYFISTLSHFAYLPVPKHKVEELGKAWSKPENIITNGAYKIVEWKPNSYVKAIKNDKFWDSKNTKINNITYYTQEDRGAILKRFRAGEIDMADDFDSSQYEWLQANLANETKVYPYNALFYLALNLTNPNSPLSNSKVREALSIAIDRDFITNNVLKSGEIPAYSMVPYGLENYQPSEYKWKQLSKEEKKAKAKQLLKEAGFDENNPLKLELSYTVSDADKKIAIAIASILKEYNVNITTNVREVGIHYGELQKHNFELGRARWLGAYDEASTFLDLFSSTNRQNYGGYNNPKFDVLLAKAKGTLNEKARNKLYNQSEDMILDNTLSIPIFYMVSKGLVNIRVQGYEQNVVNFHPTRFLWLKD